MQQKTLSGFHCDFGACISVQGYLLYLRHCLTEAGDKALLVCAYPTMDNRLKRCSMESYKPLCHASSSAADWSLSSYPGATNFHTKTSSAVEAMEQAAIAITTRENE